MYLVRNNDFPSIVVIFFVFSFVFLSENKKKIFVVGVYRSQSQCIAAHASQAPKKVQHVRLTKAGIVRPANTCMKTRL